MSSFHEITANATRILSNKRLRAAYLYRAEFCKYYKHSIHGTCPYGVRCERAHTIHDWQPKKCLYGEFCYKNKPHYMGVSCMFWHPEDGEFEAWVSKLKHPRYFHDSAQLCPHMSESRPCTIQDCVYAHAIQDIKFHGKCDCPSSTSSTSSIEHDKCLLFHDGETREQFVRRIHCLVVEPWMYSDGNHQAYRLSMPRSDTTLSEPTFSEPSSVSLKSPKSDSLGGEDEEEMQQRFCCLSPTFTAFMNTPIPGAELPSSASASASVFSTIGYGPDESLDDLYHQRDELRSQLMALMRAMKDVENRIESKQRECTQHDELSEFLHRQRGWMTEKCGAFETDQLFQTIHH